MCVCVCLNTYKYKHLVLSYYFLIKNTHSQPAVVAHAFFLALRRGQISVSGRPTTLKNWVPRHPGIYKEDLSKKQKKRKESKENKLIFLISLPTFFNVLSILLMTDVQSNWQSLLFWGEIIPRNFSFHWAEHITMKDTNNDINIVRVLYFLTWFFNTLQDYLIK